jgi:hypothetical protein
MAISNGIGKTGYNAGLAQNFFAVGRLLPGSGIKGIRFGRYQDQLIKTHIAHYSGSGPDIAGNFRTHQNNPPIQ